MPPTPASCCDHPWWDRVLCGPEDSTHTHRSTTRAHRQLTPWKTQCAQSDLPMAECLSMECQSIDRVWPNLELCWALEPTQGNVVHGPSSLLLLGFGCSLLCVSPRAAVTCHSTSLWELTGECVIGPWGALEDVKWSGASNGDDGTDRGAKGIAAPEVKFLDRRRTNCSEGVLQVRVRRSRMRVWGAKMIRHRRSPAP